MDNTLGILGKGDGTGKGEIPFFSFWGKRDRERKGGYSYKKCLTSEVLAKLRKTVTPAKAVRLRRTELFELTGFPLSRE